MKAVITAHNDAFGAVEALKIEVLDGTGSRVFAHAVMRGHDGTAPPDLDEALKLVNKLLEAVDVKPSVKVA